MTTDALLNILLLVVVPGLMAVIGGHLAAKALESSKERTLYRAVFGLLFAISIVLSVWQQIRVTKAEEAGKNQAHLAQTKAEGDMQYLKGELNLLAMMLTKQPSPVQQQSATRGATNRPGEPISHDQIREQLAIFFQEGENLKQRCLKEPNPPIDDANVWATKVHLFIRAKLGQSFDVRFLNPPEPLPLSHTGVSTQNDNLWRALDVRTGVLRSFLAELPD